MLVHENFSFPSAIHLPQRFPVLVRRFHTTSKIDFIPISFFPTLLRPSDPLYWRSALSPHYRHPHDFLDQRSNGLRSLAIYQPHEVVIESSKLMGNGFVDTKIRIPRQQAQSTLHLEFRAFYGHKKTRALNGNLALACIFKPAPSFHSYPSLKRACSTWPWYSNGERAEIAASQR